MSAAPAPSAGSTGTTGYPVVDELVELIGAEAASALVQTFAGQRLHVPLRIGADHPIAQAVGEEHAQRLSQAFGASRIELPVRLRRAVQIRLLDAAGFKRNEIAARVGVSVRSVYVELARAADPRQGNLFPG